MVDQNPKRSNEPPVWLMFSAGGMVSGLAFPVLILILGILLPFGIISPDNIIAFSHHWFGKLVILALTIFPMWAGLHRLHHGMHDIKVHVPNGGLIFYGLAAVYSFIVLFAVIAI
ncbi:fumarate reductase subunit FrdD [Basfia succiniciproducens]|uniref:Fumarate reductase subunit D n=2 Tax=Basfia TaxID=697331 RepID=FRDD_MANSM|nr:MULTISPECIES: fumarate reductase subunit FrdD [Basfia]Q65RZ8.1 RecName: Full=Fumarate reductase subunit D; AltName: Full=Quinol-fumarate reductase subunit D; Short=QFR subunit D [[Mannheimia] succiniciproducens MBEL55E]AAU38262.1 FrdD protein [[Mannheimia] succiniciproducens MBEL55E]QIM68904.1 fumarate reductase [Basfia succiniciproducens]SCY02075.1 succinate dehydrogenase subunit D [Basfia succiniciproducens]